MHAWKHFKTITFHKFLVMKGCFAVGLYRQGLLHDLSKYTPSEFLVGAKYYQGNRSPNNAEREEIGYSSAWLHHKGRNRHHYEYWIDYCADEGTDKHGMKPAPMPDRYIVEMFMDRVAASKVYNGKDYTDQDALAYYERGGQNESVSASVYKETAGKAVTSFGGAWRKKDLCLYPQAQTQRRTDQPVVTKRRERHRIFI